MLDDGSGFHVRIDLLPGTAFAAKMGGEMAISLNRGSYLVLLEPSGQC